MCRIVIESVLSDDRLQETTFIVILYFIKSCILSQHSNKMHKY